MNVHPFLLLKQSTAQRIQQGAASALERWTAVWGLKVDGGVVCAAASEQSAQISGGRDWCRRRLSDGTITWIQVQDGLARQMEQLQFGLCDADATTEKHLSSSIASAVVADALENLAAELISEISGQTSEPTPEEGPPPAHMLRRGSGAVVCSVSLNSKFVKLILPATALPTRQQKTMPVTHPAIVALPQALAKVQITLSAEVSRAELTLGYLGTLAVGDVLALPTGMDQILRLCGPGDATICHAHLGNVAGFHAVELVKA